MTFLINFSSGPGPLGAGVSVDIRPSTSSFEAALRGDGQAAAAATAFCGLASFAFLAWLTLLALSLPPLIT